MVITGPVDCGIGLFSGFPDKQWSAERVPDCLAHSEEFFARNELFKHANVSLACSLSFVVMPRELLRHPR